MPESLFPRLEPLLPSVSKPIQYVGGELNAVDKDWDCGAPGETVRWALMYPDASSPLSITTTNVRSPPTSLTCLDFMSCGARSGAGTNG